ncbi:MAG: hypothetical protein LBS16_00840 [Prevotellaceae bacterium]|nr:hypothetical protein [Prevotellaceae bacterium]
MKTNLFLFAALTAAFLSVASFAAAQVTIGGSDLPKAGTIVDLNPQNGVKGGLALSNVSLTDLEKIPVGDNLFPGIDGTNDNVNSNLTGAIVWNTNDNLLINGDGLYLWDGNKWNYIGGSDGLPTPLAAVIIMPDTDNGTHYGSITFTITKPADERWGGSYWSSLSSANITAYRNNIEIPTVEADFKPGGSDDYTYTISSATDVNQPNTYIVVSGKVNGVDITTATSGNVTLKNTVIENTLTLAGIWCFNVADANTKLGSLNSYDYTISGTVTDGSISSVVWSYTETSTVKTFTPDGSGAGSKVSVTYDDYNKISAGTTVTITATVKLTGNDGSINTVTLTRTVKCQGTYCCKGLLVPNGAYNQHTDYDIVHTNVSDDSQRLHVLSNWTSGKAGKDLCYYYRDASTGIMTGTAAGTICTGTGVDATDKSAGGWRLPNIAELAVLGIVVSTSGEGGVVNKGIGNQSEVTAKADDYLPAESTTIEGTVKNLLINRHWSSTKRNSGACWLWLYEPTNRRPGYLSCDNTTYQHHVRCVRTME